MRDLLQEALTETDDRHLDVLHQDLRSSYTLAMRAAGVTDEQLKAVQTEVDDYVTNQWF